MTDNADTKRTLDSSRAERERADASTIFKRVMQLVASGCVELARTTDGGDFGHSLVVAARLTRLWIEGCAAYQRLRSGMEGESPALQAAIATQQKSLLKELDKLVVDTLSQGFRAQATELRVTVLMSLAGQYQGPLSRATANTLSRLLRLDVKIEAGSALRDWAELHFVLGTGRMIHPTSVHIGDDAANEQRLLQANISARCERYNRLLGELSRVRARCTALLQRGHTLVKPGSPMWLTSQSLKNLDTDIERRQFDNMPNCAVPLPVLDAESDYLEMYYRRVDAVITQAEAIELERLCEADTVDQALDL